MFIISFFLDTGWINSGWLFIWSMGFWVYLLIREEVSLLLCRLYRTAAVGDSPVHHLGRGPEGLAGSTVKALIMALIDIAFSQSFLKILAPAFHGTRQWYG